MRTSILRHAATAVIPPRGSARQLAGVNLASAIGKGIFLSGSAVYFTTVTRLSAPQVGFGISAAALSGFAASLVFGVLADRIGARRLLALLTGLQAVGISLYPAVHSAPFFYAVIIAVGFVEYGAGPALAALVSSMIIPEQRVQIRAVLRSVFNVGFSAGSGLTALALLGGGVLVRVLPWCTGGMLTCAAILVLRLPGGTAVAGTAGARRFGVFRDLRFFAVVALSAPLALHASIILTVIPLWTITRTHAPHTLVPLLLVANTAFVILFQVSASHGAETVPGAARLARRSGLWLAAGCGVAAVAAYGSGLIACVVLGAAMLLLTIAELQQSASGWGLAHGLAPDHAQGEYLGAFNLHIVAQGALGPGAVTALTLSFRSWGWAAVAMLALAASLLIVPAVDAASRSMTHEFAKE